MVFRVQWYADARQDVLKMTVFIVHLGMVVKHLCAYEVHNKLNAAFFSINYRHCLQKFIK